jgi:hypothetical protein
MGTDKRSVSFEPGLAEAMDEAAREEGQSFSQWLAGAAEMRLRVHNGLKAVADWEAEHGALTDDELANADDVLDRLLGERAEEARPVQAPTSARAAAPRTTVKKARARAAPASPRRKTPRAAG